jgi:hypothetical protein
MPLDFFSELGIILSGASAAAVIAGAVFIVLQMRQNARLIEATLQQNRGDAAFRILERFTDDTFAARRHRMHQVVAEAKAKNWVGFDDTLDDFESRNFGYMYALIGEFTREKILDLELVESTLQYLVVTDWEAFRPLDEHLLQKYGRNLSTWASFEWLAGETKTFLEDRELHSGAHVHGRLDAPLPRRPGQSASSPSGSFPPRHDADGDRREPTH